MNVLEQFITTGELPKVTVNVEVDNASIVRLAIGIGITLFVAIVFNAVLQKIIK